MPPPMGDFFGASPTTHTSPSMFQEAKKLLHGKSGLLERIGDRSPIEIPGVHQDRCGPLRDRMPQEYVATARSDDNETGFEQHAQHLCGFDDRNDAHVRALDSIRSRARNSAREANRSAVKPSMQSSSASRAIRSASRRVFPWVTTPGTCLAMTVYPFSCGS